MVSVVCLVLQCDRNKEVLGLVQVLSDNFLVTVFLKEIQIVMLGLYSHSSILSEDSDFKIGGTET